MPITPTVKRTHRKIYAAKVEADVADVTTLKLSGTTISSVVPLAATAMTQTYSTAAATVPAATTHTITDSTGGTPSTTALVAISAGYVQSEIRNNLATLAAESALLAADIVALKKVVNQIIDDLQVAGIET